MGEKGAQWLVTLARLWCTSATSVPPFSHPERYLVGPLGPFLTFWAIWVCSRALSGSGPTKVGVKWCGSQNWWVPRAQVASRPPWGPFLVILVNVFIPFGHLGGKGSEWVRGP